MSTFLPDSITIEHGLQINKKIIPFGATWKKDIKINDIQYRVGDKYKADLYMPCINGITIHNTNAIKGEENNAERYAQATYNQNMKDARVHYYVDNICAWQLLMENEQGWHAGTGNGGPGNRDTIAIEIIMDGSGSHQDIKAENNGAKLTAILLRKYNLSINDVYTHQHWSKKYCPRYLLENWTDFRVKVNKFMMELLYMEKATTNPSVAEDFIRDRAQLGKQTMDFLKCYKYSDNLLLKIAKAITTIDIEDYKYLHIESIDPKIAEQYVRENTKLEEQTLTYLKCYKYADSLFVKLAYAMGM